MAKRKRKPDRKKKSKPSGKEQKPTPPAVPSPLPELELPESEKSSDPAWKLWEAFQAADYEEQIALCHQTIEEETLMDDEMAFEMLNTIFYNTVEHNERYRYEELANKLRERLPEVFAHEAHYILDWQITNALAEGRLKDVLPLAQELAQTGGKYLDMFTQTLDRLEYHGQLSVLLKIMPIAWPDVKNSTGYFEWAVDEFASRAADYIVFEHLELNPALEADDPELQKKLGFYLDDMDQPAFAKFLDHLTGRVERSWTMSDFGFERQVQGRQKSKKPAKTAKLSDEAGQNLHDLTVQFLRYLRYQEDEPYTKGELARKQIYSYLLQRHAGELEPEEDMFEDMTRGPRRRKRKPKSRYPDHWLCPDGATLDRFLAQLLDFLSARYHAAVATFELVPAWLRFLESRHLIDDKEYARTLQALRGLDTELLKIVQDHSDPALARAIEQWREK